MIRRKDSNRMGNLILIGIAGLLVGFGLIFFGLIGSFAIGGAGMAMAGLGIILCLGGGGLTLGSLIYGIRQEKGDAKETRVFTIPNTTITARFAINRLGETIFDSDYIEFDDPKTKLFIRLAVPGQPPLELKTNQPVWMSCGEGMRGHAHVQGDWLGRFEQVAVPPPSGNPYIK